MNAPFGQLMQHAALRGLIALTTSPPPPYYSVLTQQQPAPSCILCSPTDCQSYITMMIQYTSMLPINFIHGKHNIVLLVLTLSNLVLHVCIVRK